MTVAAGELGLDLDAFEGPFDLLVTLVLREELELADVAIADIVSTVSCAARLPEHAPGAERPPAAGMSLDACGEFLVLVASLLELKVRELLGEDGDELENEDLDGAAEELAERLAAYRRIREAALWLERRLAEESDRFFRLGPAPLAPAPSRRLAHQEPGSLAAALRGLAAEPPELSLRHLVLTFPPVSLFLGRFRAVLRRRRRLDFDKEVGGLSRIEQAVAFLALLELRKAGEVVLGQTGPFEPIVAWSARSD